jgi:hypothetical protein
MKLDTIAYELYGYIVGQISKLAYLHVFIFLAA